MDICKMMAKGNRLKIVNDPLYGFIQIPSPLIFELIEHPFFQRLRRIRQLGMTHLVYPGAHHTRFHHALGAMHLMVQAIEVLRSKGHIILDEEAEAVTIAILLHDIGHGPFSHALEYSLVNSLKHEELSALFMDRLNRDFGGKLDLAIKIFRNQYSKKFLHQLVSSQLDMDRLDYLNRDSFFTGVSEGVISSERIIKMLDIDNDSLVIEEKGIYSIEKFIVARRLMYWQVYLHKTVVSAECLLINILRRARELVLKGEQLFATPALSDILFHSYSKTDFVAQPELLDRFAALDDSDITTAIKVWQKQPDVILSTLCSRMINRQLFRLLIQNEPFDKKEIEKKKEEIAGRLGLSITDAGYFVIHGTLENNAYSPETDKINIIYKNGTVKDISEAADTLNIKMLSMAVRKEYLCYPKES